ncbi:MAG: heme exporter protein CcmB [Anaerolineae bacterium]|nr:heme exporter protein CcmB [Anaerolineae bacterium]
MSFFKAVWVILHKDLLNEKRTFVTLGSMLVFALIVILIFLFAFNLAAGLRQETACGVIWVTLCFSGTLSLERSMALERESDGLDGLMLAPHDHTVIFTAKVLSNWLFMLLTAVIVIAAYALFGNVALFSPGFMGVILLGTLGYILIGTLVETLNIQIKSHGHLLSVLLFPLLIPLIMAAVNASALTLNGADPLGLRTWLGVLAGYDLLFLAAGIMLYDKILEE